MTDLFTFFIVLKIRDKVKLLYLTGIILTALMEEYELQD